MNIYVDPPSRQQQQQQQQQQHSSRAALRKVDVNSVVKSKSKKKRSVRFDDKPTTTTIASSSSSLIQSIRSSLEEEEEEEEEEVIINGCNNDNNNLGGDTSFVLQPKKQAIERTAASAASSSRLIIPELSISNFQESIWLDFGGEDGSNVVGNDTTRSFVLLPSSSRKKKNVLVGIEKVPFKKGFRLLGLSKEEEEQQQILIKSTDEEPRKLITVQWNPVEAGRIREVIYLKLHPRGRLRIILCGSARSISATSKGHTRNNKEKMEAHKRSTSVDAMNPLLSNDRSRANDVSQTMSARKRSSMGLKRNASRMTSSSTTTVSKVSNRPRISIDPVSEATQSLTVPHESWAEKQGEAFISWLNYTLNPSFLGEDGDRNSAFCTLLIHRRWAKAKTEANFVYNHERFFAIRECVCSEIKRGRLSLRKDRDIYDDLSLRKSAVSMLMSYRSSWLRLALETVLGEEIHLKSKQRGKNLKSIVTDRILSDSALLFKYTKGKCKMPAGIFVKRYKREINILRLQRMFEIILFLDEAKQRELFETNPPLFNNEASLKSSKEVLVQFCKEFLSGEGNIIKHLSHMGIKVFYEQKPIEEVDFEVKNIATDLRDGVRLARLSEKLFDLKSRSLSNSMRLPAVSRLQKIHNVDVVLSFLQNKGMPLIDTIEPKHIVDCHQKKVLLLLWVLMAEYELPKLLDISALECEIERVDRSNRSRSILMKPSESYSNLARASLSEEYSPDYDIELVQTLLAWCKSVCSCFGLPIEKFSTSFADGKAICYLIHYYHPTIISLEYILPTSRDLPRRNFEVEALRWGDSKFDPKVSTSDFDKAINNERSNWVTANRSMTELGGIPGMMPVADTLNFPEERSTIVCVAYLCSRLMASSKELRAIITIQRFVKACITLKLYKKQMEAASVIAKYWAKYQNQFYKNQSRNYGRSVRIIEKFVLKYWFRFKEIQVRNKETRAATLIQTVYRGYVTRDDLYFANQVATLIQCYYRRFKAMKLMKTTQQATIKIQTAIRRFLCRNRYVFVRAAIKFEAATTIQQLWRGYICRKVLEANPACQINGSVLVIQSLARVFLARVQMKNLIEEKFFVESNAAACSIQKLWRGHVSRAYTNALIKEKYRININTAACFIQKVWRGHTSRICMDVLIEDRHIMNVNIAACSIQKIWRGFLARRRVRNLVEGMFILNNSSACSIQKLWRGYTSRLSTKILIEDTMELKLSNAACSIQMVWRGFLARQKVSFLLKENYATKINVAACYIQKLWRGQSSRVYARSLIEEFQTKQVHVAACTFQKIWRGFSQRREYSSTINSVVVLQSFGRMLSCRKHFILMRMASSTLRRYFVIWNAKLKEERVRSVVTIQANIRRFIRRRQYLQGLKSVVLIQTIFRTQCVRNEVQRRTDAVKVIQSTWRMLCFKRKTVERRAINMAAIKIQKRWRGFCDRCDFLNHRHAAKIVQKVFRGHLARRLRREMHYAATQIQKIWRGTFEHCNFMIFVVAAIQIQSEYRRYAERKKFSTVAGGVILFQGCIRGVLVRKRLASEALAVTKIQARWRSHQCRYSYHDKLWSSLVIQSWYRCICKYRVHRKQQAAAILIQSNVRGFLQRNDLELKNFAACEIQRVWRGTNVQYQFMLVVLSALKIQCTVRSFLAKRLELKSIVCTKIQALVRGYFARCEYTLRLKERELYLSERKKRNDAAKIIQQVFVRHMRRQYFTICIIVIQRFVRKCLDKQKCCYHQKAALVIQSAYRAWKVSMARSRDLKLLAKRVKEANQRARLSPEMKLGNRTKSSLYLLQNSSRLTEVIRACYTLEVSTRLSRGCCQDFSLASAPQILYSFILTCNRSLPHIEVMEQILLILLNVSKHKDLIASISCPESIDVLLSVLQNFRDKDPIFLLAVKLMRVICSFSDDLRAKCASKEKKKILIGIQKLLHQKGKTVGTSYNQRTRPQFNSNVSSNKSMIDKNLRLAMKYLNDIIINLE